MCSFVFKKTELFTGRSRFCQHGQKFKYGTMKQFNPPRAARRPEHHSLKASSISFFMKGEGQGSIKRSVQIFLIISSYFLQQIVHLKGTQ